MTERRALIEGLKPAPLVDPTLEQQFVFRGKVTPSTETPPRTSDLTPALRAPISTRIRADLAHALKRASLERQLAGQEPHRLQEILEVALEPWLKSQGYLP